MKRLSALLIAALLMASFMGLAFTSVAHATNQGVVFAQAFNACTSGTSGGTCSITLGNTVYGDLLIVTAEESATAGLSDSFSSVFTTAVSEAGQAFVYYTQLVHSGSDTITLTTTGSATVAFQVFEVQGLFTDFVITTGTGTGSSATLSTAAVSYSGFTWFCVGSLYGAGGALTAGTSFTLVQNGAVSYLGAEYSITVASGTTFPATAGSSGTWYDAGACFARSYIHPSDIQLVQMNTPATSPYFYINEYQNSYLQVGYPSATPNCPDRSWTLNVYSVVDEGGER